METCNMCGKEFDRYEAEDEFNEEYSKLFYSNFSTQLCGDCAIEVIEDMIEGYYYDICDRCGKSFDYVEECSEFSDNFPWYNGTVLIDYWGSERLCADCAMEDAESLD